MEEPRRGAAGVRASASTPTAGSWKDGGEGSFPVQGGPGLTGRRGRPGERDHRPSHSRRRARALRPPRAAAGDTSLLSTKFLSRSNGTCWSASTPASPETVPPARPPSLPQPPPPALTPRQDLSTPTRDTTGGGTLAWGPERRRRIRGRTRTTARPRPPCRRRCVCGRRGVGHVPRRCGTMFTR